MSQQGSSDSQPKQMLLVEKTAAQAVLDYLANRPYHETYKLIPGLMNLQAAPDTTAQVAPAATETN
jgi:hypothetical protein